jgi:hypothetical protein
MGTRLEFHERVDRHTCKRCGGDYDRVYGTIWDDERRAGIYSADLHQRDDDTRLLLAIGTMGWDAATEQWRRYGVTLEVWPTADENRMSFRDVAMSPYAETDQFGQRLDREEALASPLRDEFFHLADHVVRDDPRVRAHLDQ